MKEDWRLLKGQEQYLQGVQLAFHAYVSNNSSNDHDHCEFCMEKFGYAPEYLQVGYSTLDNYHWICQQCFEDFKDQFMWIIVDN